MTRQSRFPSPCLMAPLRSDNGDSEQLENRSSKSPGPVPCHRKAEPRRQCRGSQGTAAATVTAAGAAAATRQCTHAAQHAAAAALSPVRPEERKRSPPALHAAAARIGFGASRPSFLLVESCVPCFPGHFHLLHLLNHNHTAIFR